jgi:hypothetical protein
LTLKVGAKSIKCYYRTKNREFGRLISGNLFCRNGLGGKIMALCLSIQFEY